MSSRARRASEPVRPFDWGPSAAPLAAPAARPHADEPAVPAQHLAALEREAFANGYAQGERAGADVAAQRAEGMMRRLAQTIDERPDRAEVVTVVRVAHDHELTAGRVDAADERAAVSLTHDVHHASSQLSGELL